ncbi:hypothetical protein BC828DRAFT_288658 [Blastocladiella britannica]|nr:hypothetical protein BC828DRAFT_288658 [Blastocladiella britannica]
MAKKSKSQQSLAAVAHPTPVSSPASTSPQALPTHPISSVEALDLPAESATTTAFLVQPVAPMQIQSESLSSAPEEDGTATPTAAGEIATTSLDQEDEASVTADQILTPPLTPTLKASSAPTTPRPGTRGQCPVARVHHAGVGALERMVAGGDRQGRCSRTGRVGAQPSDGVVRVDSGDRRGQVGAVAGAAV